MEHAVGMEEVVNVNHTASLFLLAVQLASEKSRSVCQNLFLRKTLPASEGSGIKNLFFYFI